MQEHERDPQGFNTINFIAQNYDRRDAQEVYDIINAHKRYR